MPSLNTLRTKGGVIVTIVIFLALLAFILSDVAGVFGNKKLEVGEINGKKVDYTEFYSTSDYVGTVYKMMWGRDALSMQEQEMVYNAAWDQLIMKYSYQPGFDKLGLKVANDEQVDMLNGLYLSPVITSTFTNPQTGMFEPEMMKMFLYNVGYDYNAQIIWEFLKSQMSDERITSKFISLVGGGFFVNDLEVTDALEMGSNRYDVKYVTQNFGYIPDSTVTVTGNDIRNYYNTHKESYRTAESRSVEYIVIDVMPSGQDFADARAEVNKIAAEFSTVEAPMQYATLNSQDRPNTFYYKESDLSPELAAITFGNRKGELYGPMLNAETFSISRLADMKMMPDTIAAKHILLEGNEKELADSLVRVIRRGSDFETLAHEYSNDQSVIQNGGDLGRFAPEQMIPEFSNALIERRAGEVFTVESPFGIHVVELTYKSPMVRKAQIATITYTVEPSAATTQAAYQRASDIATASGGTLEGFRQATSAEALPKRNAFIRNTDRNVSGFNDSRELVRWAFNSKQGAVSSIMELDGDYVIAALSSVQEAGYTPVEEVTSNIRSTLVREAKGKMLMEQMKGNSLEEIAARMGTEVNEAKGIDPMSFFIPEIGMEQKFMGAIPEVGQGKISKPLTGMTGVFVFQVENIVPAENLPTVEDARIAMQAGNEYGLQQRTVQALTEESDIKDMRVRYF